MILCCMLLVLVEVLCVKFVDLLYVIWGDGGDGINFYGGLFGWVNCVVVLFDLVNLFFEVCVMCMLVMVVLVEIV